MEWEVSTYVRQKYPLGFLAWHWKEAWSEDQEIEVLVPALPCECECEWSISSPPSLLSIYRCSQAKWNWLRDLQSLTEKYEFMFLYLTMVFSVLFLTVVGLKTILFLYLSCGLFLFCISHEFLHVLHYSCSTEFHEIPNQEESAEDDPAWPQRHNKPHSLTWSYLRFCFFGMGACKDPFLVSFCHF